MLEKFVYHALTKGVQHKLMFLSGYSPYLTNVFENSEKILREKLLLVFTERNAPSPPICELLAIPSRNGGVSIMTPVIRRNNLTSAKKSDCLD